MAKEQKIVMGAPMWMVTFADLMSLLVCFFVLIVSFSIQDKKKMQVVAGSMRDAFGVQFEKRTNGIIEREGVPIRDYQRDVAVVETDADANQEAVSIEGKPKQGQEDNTHAIKQTTAERARKFASAAASLRQAWQKLPEVAELSKNVVIQETEEGLNIQLIDQDGRSMFPEGSKYPYESTRKLLFASAPVLRRMPNRLRLTGHTTAGQVSADNTYTEWELSSDRANAARSILAEAGIPADKFFSVVGKGSSEPLFSNDPFLTANRRIEILLMYEAPPLPTGHKL